MDAGQRTLCKNGFLLNEFIVFALDHVKFPLQLHHDPARILTILQSVLISLL
jgi:hypothetical protein